MLCCDMLLPYRYPVANWYSTPILIPQMVRWEMERRERNELGSEGKQSTAAREGQSVVAQALQLICRRKSLLSLLDRSKERRAVTYVRIPSRGVGVVRVLR